MNIPSIIMIITFLLYINNFFKYINFFILLSFDLICCIISDNNEKMYK